MASEYLKTLKRYARQYDCLEECMETYHFNKEIGKSEEDACKEALLDWIPEYEDDSEE